MQRSGDDALWSLRFDLTPVVVVAGGPSVSLPQIRHIGIARSSDRCRVIAINDSIYPCWFADMLYAADRQWWALHSGVPGFEGLKVSVEETSFPGIIRLENTGQDGFDERLGCIKTGSNSGYQAVHLAAQLGAKRIILVGFDFSENGARDHWHGRHAGRLDMSSNVAKWRTAFRGLTDILENRGVSVLNASPRSTLNWLRKFDVKSLSEGALQVTG